MPSEMGLEVTLVQRPVWHAIAHKVPILEEASVSLVHWSFLIPKVDINTPSYSSEKSRGVGQSLVYKLQRCIIAHPECPLGMSGSQVTIVSLRVKDAVFLLHPLEETSWRVWSPRT